MLVSKLGLNRAIDLAALLNGERPEDRIRALNHISAQSPLGNGTSAMFEDVSLTSTNITDFRRGE